MVIIAKRPQSRVPEHSWTPKGHHIKFQNNNTKHNINNANDIQWLNIFNTYTTYNIIWQNNDIHDSNASCLKHRLVYSQALFPSPFAMSITIPTLHSFCCSCPYVLIPSGVAPTERVHVTIQNWGIIVLCGCENWLSQMLEEVVCQLGLQLAFDFLHTSPLLLGFMNLFHGSWHLDCDGFGVLGLLPRLPCTMANVEIFHTRNLDCSVCFRGICEQQEFPIS